MTDAAVGATRAAETASDPIRRSRQLMFGARSLDDPGAVAEVSAELRSLGRGDLALRLVDDHGSRLSRRLLEERAKALDALGYSAEAAGVRAALDQPVVPVWRTSERKAGNALALARRGAALTRNALARGASQLMLGAGRVLSGRRPIYVTEMKWFSRLADFIERLDPIARRLTAKHGPVGYRLIVIFYGGYPNETMVALYRNIAPSSIPRRGSPKRLPGLLPACCATAESSRNRRRSIATSTPTSTGFRRCFR